MLSSEPQLITRISPMITYLKKLGDFPEHGWNSRNQRRHTALSQCPRLARPRPLSLPSSYQHLRSALPVPAGGASSSFPETTAWGRRWVCRQSWTPQPLGAVHLIQFQATGSSTGQTAEEAQQVLPACPTFHAPTLNTLPPGSSCHGHFKIITCPRVCRNIFSRNASRVLIFEKDLEISLGLGNIRHHLMKSVWGWSSMIFLRLLLKRPSPETRITS